MGSTTIPDSPAAARVTRIPAPLLGALLALLLAALVVQSVRTGPLGAHPLSVSARGVLASLGVAQELDGSLQSIVEIRLRRTLVALGVGAALAYSGALLQGLFRNGLASPSVLGITSGAAFGASLAILVLGGYGPAIVAAQSAGLAPVLVTAFGFCGALAVALLVATIATTGGRISVPTLLLVGVAINMCLGGLMAAVQSLTLADFEISRAILAWTFGTLDDRSPAQVNLLWVGLALAATIIPFVGLELDLFAGGEDDAEALGVNAGRVKLLVLVAAALAASVAVAVAGQIAFVGLVVPHVLRLLSGTSNRALLPLTLVGGPVFLLGADVIQHALLGNAMLQPGVMMSMVGGPLFLALLVRSRREMRTW